MDSARKHSHNKTTRTDSDFLPLQKREAASPKPAILVVEDDRRLSDINRRALESEGYNTIAAYTLAGARAILKETPEPFDIILLDVKLPDGRGFELCREIRSATNAHIIFLTSVTEDKGELEGLEAGGDDYLRKPYDIDLLRQRVKNALQRGAAKNEKQGNPGHTIIKGNLTLDILANRAMVNGLDVALSQKEFALLTLFAQSEGETIESELLLKKIWGCETSQGSQAIKSSISRLRTKLAGSGYTIIHDRLAKGYCFETE